MTPSQISIYFDSIKKVSGTLVSLNRNKKIQPDGTLVNLVELIELRRPQIILNEDPCSFYKLYPTSFVWPSYKTFDGTHHLKIIKF